MTEKLTTPPARRPARRAPVRDFRALAVPYTAGRGRRREAVLGVDSAGEWAVYDIVARGHAKTGKVVQALEDERDRVRQAIALQADYTDTQAAYYAGRREEDPLPKFTRLPLSRIAEHAERAVQLALTQAAADDRIQLTEQLLALANESPTSAAANGSSQTNGRST
jgi:hypothetical protein